MTKGSIDKACKHSLAKLWTSYFSGWYDPW